MRGDPFHSNSVPSDEPKPIRQPREGSVSLKPLPNLPVRVASRAAERVELFKITDAFRGFLR